MSRKSEVSHSTTVTNYRIPLDIYPDAALREFYEESGY